MAKLLFTPLSIGGGLLAGFLGKKVFNQVWGLIDEEEPPDSKHRDVSWGRLLLAGALQGAIFRASRSHGPRRQARLLPHDRQLAGREAPRSRVTSPKAGHSRGARTGALAALRL